ncbi:hypothetical protein [Pectobacterium carotovorum]|uniref:hypothetical protein n=1 Tax=Pectobacterium carotovorum TaxID=554 RepID=UPI0005045506|nr:hypothetical protein [Pectobacterium carotovorum]KFW97585.1 hypothetical protein JV33_21520 [Pectobacterium carotovorum subsp. carotovorum]KML64945.1 hypothetical protein G032_21000 [Pectobacterium carotovorum subsp. carotovorum ICMP 5702]SHH68225.1 hypothetical protein SAMN05444147_11613 [Pectobacterium carotovorum]
MKEATNLTIYKLYLSYRGNCPYQMVFFSLEALEEFTTRLPDDTEIREQETKVLFEPFYRDHSIPWVKLAWHEGVLNAGSVIEDIRAGFAGKVRCYTISSLMSSAQERINEINNEQRKRADRFFSHYYD